MVQGARLSQALSKDHAVSALLALLDGPLSVTQLTSAMGGSTGTGKVMADHLATAGLAQVETLPGFAGKPAYLVSLTPVGSRVARGLAAVAGSYEDG